LEYKSRRFVTDTFDFACSLLLIKACSFSLDDEQALRRRITDVIIMAFVIFFIADTPFCVLSKHSNFIAEKFAEFMEFVTLDMIFS
jgi:hypothetical protein